MLRDDTLLGTTLLGYRVVAWMAEGLYTAVHPSSEAQTGVRVLTLPVGESRSAPDLLEELRRASAVTESVGVQPIDGGKLADGRFFYLFSWARRYRMEPLMASLQRAPRPLVEALEIAVDLCAALEVAHTAGLFHNALSGESILLTYGVPGPGGGPGSPGMGLPKVQLLDLGLLRRMSQGASELADPRNDVYTVGTLLYQLATGTSLQAASAFAGPGADLPAEFQAVVLRALAQRKEDRHASISALRKDLVGLLREARPAKGRSSISMGSMGSMGMSSMGLSAGADAAPQPPTRRRGQVVLPVLTAFALLVALSAGGSLIYLVGPRSLMQRFQHGPAQGHGLVPLPGMPPRTPPGPPDATAPSKGKDSADDSHLDGPAALLVPLGIRAQAEIVLTEARRSPVANMRLCAAGLIGRSGDPRLRLQAEGLLNDADPRVAARAAWALGLLGDQAAVVALAQAAAGHQADMEAGVSLLQLGDYRGLELLRGVLRGKNDSERLEAALWLGEHGEPEAWRVLRHLLTLAQDEDPLRHLAILGRLCRGRDQAACQQLRERLSQSPGSGGSSGSAGSGGGLRGEARVLVGSGLMQAGDALGYRVLHQAAEDPVLRLPALRALAEGGLDDQEERWLLDTLGTAEKGDGEARERARAAAAEALGIAAAVEALPALSAALSNAPPSVRCAAAGAILRLTALEPRLLLQRASEWAQAGIAEPRAATRLAAVATLSLGSAALAEPLLEVALKDREAEVRALSARALGDLHSAAALPALQGALGDRDSLVRVAAVRALGHIDQASARAMVRERLDKGTLSEQVAAAGILSAQGERSHQFVLRQALHSPDTAVRRQVIEQALTEPDLELRAALLGAGLSDAADEIQLLSAVGLARSADRRGLAVLKAQPGLLLAQRLLARDALARLKESVPPLDLMAALGAAGEGQRAAAMAVAKDLLPETGLTVVRRGLRDAASAVRLQAAAAAAELPMDPRTQEQLLLQLYGDPDAAVQARALGLLGNLLATAKTSD